jgi:hypothetical protein
MSKEWTSKPLIEHIDHVWYDHGNLFSSQIREEMGGDERAMELVEEFEESWRNLQSYVLDEIDDHRKKIREQKLKERIKPLIHKKLDELQRNK